MRISDYTRGVVFICALLGIIIIGLSFALYSQGPRVRFIRNIDSVGSSALTIGSNLQIIFDRPIEQRDYSSLISISPDTAFITQTNTQSITLTLKANLQSDTNYTVSVHPEIHDKSGKKMKNRYEYSFVTEQPSYAYLERNYGLDPDSDINFLAAYTDAADHIKLSTLGAEPEVIFSHPQIRLFAANNHYAVVAVKEDERDELYTINLNTKEVQNEQLWSKGRINNLVLAPRGKTAIYTTQPDYTSVSPEYYEEFANRIKSLNLEEDTVLNLTDAADTPLKAYSIDTDADGQIILMQDTEQAYYAVSPFNDFDPVLIGSYSDTFGFTRNGAEIIFRDNGELVRYDIANTDIVTMDFDSGGYILDIRSRDNTVSFSSTVYSPESPYSLIENVSEWGDDPMALWRSELGGTKNLRDFSPSYDNTLLALQFHPEKCRYDDIGAGSECMNVFQQIVDPETGDTLEEFRGSSFMWLP